MRLSIDIDTSMVLHHKDLPFRLQARSDGALLEIAPDDEHDIVDELYGESIPGLLRELADACEHGMVASSTDAENGDTEYHEIPVNAASWRTWGEKHGDPDRIRELEHEIADRTSRLAKSRAAAAAAA